MNGLEYLKAEQQARAEYDESTARYEAAVMARDEQARSDLQIAVLAAGEKYATALRASIIARRRAAPTFEDLLRDPTQQLDIGGDVFKSVYRNVVDASVSAPRLNGRHRFG